MVGLFHIAIDFPSSDSCDKAEKQKYYETQLLKEVTLQNPHSMLQLNLFGISTIQFNVYKTENTHAILR